MNNKQDTVFALSTTPGRSALSVIRITGKKSFYVVKKLTKNKSTQLENRKALTTHIYNKNNSLIDKVVVTFFYGPNSYTGEDLVEITTHGNPIIVDSVFNSLLDLGLRLANPGEFTSRAYNNKKIDLIQAESTLSVINSKSIGGVRSSLLGVVGKLSNKLEKIRQLLVLSLGELEYELDISELDNKKKVIKKAKKNIQKAIKEMRKLIRSHKKASIFNDGARVAIVGPPNAGKSTLLNALTNQERAIVTKTPGTTRDTIEALVYYANYPVLLIDTAGIRKTKDKIEKLGIKKTEREIKAADIVYNVQLTPTNKNTKTNQNKTINILNKSDLITKEEKEKLQENHPKWVIISAKNKEGLKQLRKKTEKTLKLKTGSNNTPFLSTRRQKTALIKSKKYLLRAIKKENLLELEIIAYNLRLSLNEFDWVLGKTTTNELLNVVFSNFCVGK